MTNLVHWHEGMLLQPQHLQAMQIALLERIQYARRCGFSYPHGVVEAVVSATDLRKGDLVFSRLWVVFRSGWEIRSPEELDLGRLPVLADIQENGPAEIHLALPRWKENGANVSISGLDDHRTHSRTFSAEVNLRKDDSDGVEECPVSVRRPNARLLIVRGSRQPHPDLDTIPLLRLELSRANTPSQELVESLEFVPPSLTLAGTRALRNMIGLLQGRLETARSALRQILIQGGYRPASMHGAELANVLHLRTLNRHLPRINSLWRAPHAEIVELFVALSQLHGDLLGLYPSDERYYSEGERLPFYSHDEPYLGFKWLCAEILRVVLKAAGHSYKEFPLKSAGSAGFEPRDILGLTELVKRLVQPSGTDLVAPYICSKLSVNTVRALNSYSGEPNEELRLLLSGEMSNIVAGESIFDPERFSGVVLPASLKQLVDRQQRNQPAPQLNRQLLQAAFPGILGGGAAGRAVTSSQPEVRIIDTMLDLNPVGWYLGVRSNQVDAESLSSLIKQGLNFVLGPPSIMTGRQAGLPLSRVDYAPPGMPEERGLHYFEILIDRYDGSAMWQLVMTEKRLAVRMGELPVTMSNRSAGIQLTNLQFSIFLALPAPLHEEPTRDLV